MRLATYMVSMMATSTLSPRVSGTNKKWKYAAMANCSRERVRTSMGPPAPKRNYTVEPTAEPACFAIVRIRRSPARFFPAGRRVVS